MWEAAQRKSDEITEIWETLDGFQCKKQLLLVQQQHDGVGRELRVHSGEQSCKKSIIVSLISPAPEGAVIHPRSERPGKDAFRDHCISRSAT